MFQIKNVSKKYNEEFALNNVSMNIENGINFIVGASGSGKTTLLKIISGMEENFDGEVVYYGKQIDGLSLEEKGYFYNNIFGFIWQDFNLIEENTVIENVMLPTYLKDNQNIKNAKNLLKKLKIFDVSTQKVKYLSGGQKQRVAIARELMKNPQVIIADEPTSALDETSSKIIMDILRFLSKTRTVIVVTHDNSLITAQDNVFELDKGELISKPEIDLAKKSELKMQVAQHLSLKDSFLIAKTNMKNKISRFFISTISLVVASLLLLTTISGAINNSSQGEFDKLLKTYGENILDLNIVGSFLNANATDDKENEKPNGNVTQNISGLTEKYQNDPRVKYIISMQAFDNIKVTLDGKIHQIEKSGNSPVLSKLLIGDIPQGDEYKVIVPYSFVKKSNLDAESAIGKEIEFSATVFKWINDMPIEKPVKIKAVICGVAENNVVTENGGEKQSYTIDDSFFFNSAAENEIRKQADIENSTQNFTMRANTPQDLISLKDELNKKGIVPLGQFELVENMVRLNNQTEEQSGSASAVIGILAFVIIIAVFLITGLMRKKEYAIYKVSGFNSSHLFKLNFSEITLNLLSSILLMLIASPVLNLATKGLFGTNILNAKMLFAGILMILLTSVVAYLTTAISFVKVNVSIALKTGDK